MDARTTQAMPNTAKNLPGLAKIRDIPGSKTSARKLAVPVKVRHS